jgi:hypothetical protein
MAQMTTPLPSRSLSKAPKSTLRWWGLQSSPAFDFATAFLNRQNCAGPATWKEGSLVPYSREICPSIRARVSLSSISADSGYATFSCVAVIFSKTIFDLSEATDPWNAGSSKPVFPGFTPCLAIRLEHLKWCEREDQLNPCWAMSLEGDTRHPSVHVWAADFLRLLVPILDDLMDDDRLEALLVKSLTKSKPQWVRSDAPYFVWLPERLRRLQSRRDVPR